MFYNTRVYQIFAIDDSNGLALRGSIPWNVPTDRRWFKHVTTEFCSVFDNSALVVGSKTFLNDFGGRRLSDRRMRVLSRTNLEIRAEDKESVSVCHSLTDLFDGLDHAMVVGGEYLYKTTAMITDETIISKISGYHYCDQVYELAHRPRLIRCGLHYFTDRRLYVEYSMDVSLIIDMRDTWMFKNWREDTVG